MEKLGAFNGLFDGIASKALSDEILLQSQKQMKVTWYKIGTIWWMVYALPTKNCNMVLRCRCRVWPHIVIQQQNTRFEKPMSLLQNHLFQLRQGVTVPRSINGSNLQRVRAKVNASSVKKTLSFLWKTF
ncbi:hypothetical protein TNCV_5039451 [Trichonephila clavipes]|nr:hypothetical protein TNCV_5039451 [Trichonephila clavipes]